MSDYHKVSVVIVTRNRKAELTECITSIYNQSLKPYEVIVVDNASEEPIKTVISKKIPKVKVIRSEINTGGAGGRNLGLKHAKGDFVLFMDDDATAGRNLLKELIKPFDNPKVGIVQPKIYEKGKNKIIQGVGHGINLLTGRVYGIGVHEKDKGQYEQIMEIPMVGCTWMVSKSVFDKIGTYDEEYFIPYEDSDFSIRATKAGFKILYVPKAIVWHTGPKKTISDPKLQWLGITIPERAYRVSRNKIIFMRKHAPFQNFLFFIFILVPIYSLLHSVIIVSSKRLDILISYWTGLFSGIKYAALKYDLKK